MLSTELKLWEQYCDEVDDKNMELLKEWNDDLERARKRTDKINRERETVYQRAVKEDARIHQAYEKLSWLEKLFTPRPPRLYMSKPWPMMAPFWIFYSVHKTYEDFLSWRVKNNK